MGCRAWFAVILAGWGCLPCLCTPAAAGPKSHVGRATTADQRVSMDHIDHADWDRLLHSYVDQQGNVDYRRWKTTSTDVTALDQYLDTLSAAEPALRASRQAILAYWINAYNAVTVRGILMQYPTTSIRNHTARVFGYNIWHDLLLHVGSNTVSLDHIEHAVLRKLEEPRIHFAIVCASKGCPRLLNEAYSAERLEEQLQSNARVFFATRANFVYDVRQGTMQLSAILDWFGEDFGATHEAQLRAIAQLLPDEAAQQAARDGSVRVSYLDYDWTLNEQVDAEP